MWFGGRQQCGRLQQQGGEDQTLSGRQWDVSHQLKFSRMLNALVDMKVVYTFNQSDHISKMRVDVDDIVDGKHN